MNKNTSVWNLDQITNSSLTQSVAISIFGCHGITSSSSREHKGLFRYCVRAHMWHGNNQRMPLRQPGEQPHEVHTRYSQSCHHNSDPDAKNKQLWAICPTRWFTFSTNKSMQTVWNYGKRVRLTHWIFCALSDLVEPFFINTAARPTANSNP